MKTSPSFISNPDEIRDQARQAIDSHRKSSASVPQNASFDDTVIPLVQAENQFLAKKQFLEFHRWLDGDIADAATEATQLFAEYQTQLGQRKDTYQAVQGLKGKDEEDAMLLEKMNLDFQTNGLHLPEEQQAKLSAIKTELEGLHSSYMKNLQGKAMVQEDFKTLKKGSLDPPTYMRIIENEPDEEIRQRAYDARTSRAVGNDKVLHEIVKLRTELAALLGYQNYADYKTSVAKTDIRGFIQNISAKLNGEWERYKEKFMRLKLQDIRNGKARTQELQPWDRAYYTKRLMERDFEVESLSFDLETTVKVMLEVYEKLFGLTFKKIDGPVWHSDVEVFEVYDQEFLGWLYMDLLSRPGKTPVFFDQPVLPGFVDTNGQRVPSATALLCSFEKGPMVHDDCILLFHELGHGIHDLVGKTKYARFHGASTGDFNEAPSQMLEQWCWDESVLRSLLKDDNLATKLSAILKARQASRFLKCYRSLEMAEFDLDMHSGETEIPDKFFTTVPQWSDDGVTVYVYLLCEIYAADMFTMFRDTMDVATGKDYVSKVIGKGGSKHHIEMLKDFLGREPNPEAFYKELGIAS